LGLAHFLCYPGTFLFPTAAQNDCTHQDCKLPLPPHLHARLKEISQQLPPHGWVQNEVGLYGSDLLILVLLCVHLLGGDS
jgi:hypothetical protein